MLRLLRPRWIVAIVLVALLAGGGGAGLARYQGLVSSFDLAHARLAALAGGAGIATVVSGADAPLSQATVVLLVPADPSRAREGVALLRLDPSQGLVSVLVIPAALRVGRPGGGLGALGMGWASGRLGDAVRAVHAYTRIAVDHVAVVPGAGVPDVAAVLRGDVATDLSVAQALALAWVNLRASRRVTCSLGGVPTTIAGQTFLQASSANTAARDAFLGTGAAPPRDSAEPLLPGCSPGA